VYKFDIERNISNEINGCTPVEKVDGRRGKRFFDQQKQRDQIKKVLVLCCTGGDED
jgi:hypothetical protein